jgi:hypothetical protein
VIISDEWKGWLNDDQKITQYIEFLVACANDCHRVYTNNIRTFARENMAKNDIGALLPALNAGVLKI